MKSLFFLCNLVRTPYKIGKHEIHYWFSIMMTFSRWQWLTFEVSRPSQPIRIHSPLEPIFSNTPLLFNPVQNWSLESQDNRNLFNRWKRLGKINEVCILTPIYGEFNDTPNILYCMHFTHYTYYKPCIIHESFIHNLFTND